MPGGLRVQTSRSSGDDGKLALEGSWRRSGQICGVCTGMGWSGHDSGEGTKQQDIDLVLEEDCFYRTRLYPSIVILSSTSRSMYSMKRPNKLPPMAGVAKAGRWFPSAIRLFTLLRASDIYLGNKTLAGEEVRPQLSRLRR